MRFIYFTDSHLRANSPASRLDDFPVTIIKKIEWICSYAEQNSINTILIGGDIVDIPNVSSTILITLLRILMRARQKGIEFYSVVGNHDEYGYNPETINRTPLGFFFEAGIIERISSTPILFPVYPPHLVSLTGVDAHAELDKNGRISDYIEVAGDDSLTKIHVMHSFLDVERWGEKIPSTAIEDVLHTKADIILTGHEHTGYGIFRKNGKIFCNPGALARVTASVGDVNKDVKIAVITVNSKTDFDVQPVYLPDDIALPADKVLDRAKLLIEKEHRSYLANFEDSLGAFYNFEVCDMYTALELISKEFDIPCKVTELARKYLQEAESKLKKER